MMTFEDLGESRKGNDVLNPGKVEEPNALADRTS